MPALEQRHWDLVGLALVAFGVFLAFLVYLGWDGGQAGDALVDGLRRLVGAVHYLVPVALVASGAVLVLRPVLPALRPFRTAGACIFLAGCLGLAAGTLGLGGDDRAVEDRGGLAGRWLYELTSTLLGDVGSHIIALFLFLAGVLLLTGASVAGVLKATGDSFTTTGRKLREGAEPVRTAVARRRSPREELDELERGDVTAAKQDFWSGADRFPDLYDGEEPEPDTTELEPVGDEPAPAGDEPGPRLAEDPETDEPGVMRGAREVAPEDLTPQGRLRRSVTDSLDRRGEPPRHRRAGEDRRPAGRGAGALRRRRARDRDGRRPAHHALRAAARARHQGRQGRAAQGRPRVRARGVRHPHPRADPRQAGGRRRGAERPPPDRA